VEALATVEKAVDVLFHLHGESGPRGVTAIGRALGLTKSSTHRLLTALGRRGLVERDERGHYRPGIGLVSLGLGAFDREPVAVAARPVLQAEAASIGETVFLVAASAGKLVVLDKAEGTGFLRAAPQVGAAVPVHATAVGKLFLAFAESTLSPVEGLTPYTDRTAPDSAALQREVERARKRGWAENHEEWISGMSVLAVPVFRHGKLLAALAVAAPTPRLRALGSDLRDRMLAAAERVAARLEGRDLP
jgi:IclR family acetate operon transcriptional repressor